MGTNYMYELMYIFDKLVLLILGQALLNGQDALRQVEEAAR